MIMPAIASIPIFFIIILFDDKLNSKLQKMGRHPAVSTSHHDRMKEADF